MTIVRQIVSQSSLQVPCGLPRAVERPELKAASHVAAQFIQDASRGSSAVPPRYCGLRTKSTLPISEAIWGGGNSSSSRKFVVAEAEAALATGFATEEAPGQVAAAADPELDELAVKPARERGGGGRRRVKARRKVPEKDGIPNLEWLQQDGIDMTSEWVVEPAELCSKSAAGLVGLQRAIWRVNRAIARSNSVREALQVVEEMKAAGLNAANEGTYVALITVCRRQRQGERALAVYQAMKGAGVKPSILAFNLLISCCQQAQRLEDAFNLKADMEELGVKPDVVTYTSLMALVVKCGPYRGRSSPAQRLTRAMELYAEMQQKGLEADAITFNTLMYAGAQAKLPGKVLEVYGQMVASGISPNQFTFGILLEAVGHGGRLKAALEVFNEMKAAGVPPLTSTYNYLLDACASAPQPDAQKAWSLYEEMLTSKGAQPNAETMNHLITASCKGGDHEGAMRAFATVKEKNITGALSIATFNKLIHSADMSGTIDQAFQMYDLARDSGYQPDVVTLGTLVSVCARNGDVERALTVKKEIEGLGVKANQVTYHALIGAYGQAGQWEDSLRTFQSMQIECADEPVTIVSYSIVFDACFGSKGVDGAVALALEQKKKLEITSGIRAAINLYLQAASIGDFKNFKMEDLSRCDVRLSTRAATVVAILAWLEVLRENPITSDLVIVTGSDKGRNVVTTPKKGRLPKLFVCVDRCLQAIGLQGKSLRALTMQALTIENKNLKAWLAGATSSPIAEDGQTADVAKAV